MSRISNGDLRQNARNKLSGNYGQGILAAVVPLIVGMIVSAFLSIFTGSSIAASTIVSIVVTSVTTYMIFKMVLNLAKNHRNAGFENSLSPSSKLIKMVAYGFLIGLFGFLLQIPANLIMFDVWYPNLDSVYIVSDTTAMTQSEAIEILTTLFQYIGLVMISGFILTIFLLPLHFTQYLLVDEDISIVESMKKSIQMMKGNYVRVIFMRLSFIGWEILVGLTLYTLYLYVGPYQQVSYANLYLVIKEENGEKIDMHNSKLSNDEIEQQRPRTDWMVETKKSDEWDFWKMN